MRPKRLLAPVLLALPGVAAAQTPEFVAVVKLQLHQQTSATQVSHDLVLPFGCDLVVVDGPALSPDPVVSGPISVGEPNHNGGVLAYNDEMGEWAYGWPNFDHWGTATKGELDALFGEGTYTFDVAGATVSLNLAGELYAANAPLLTLGGGYWDGGRYVLEQGQPLTVHSGVYPEFGTHVEDAVVLIVEGCDYVHDEISFATSGGTNSLSHTVPGGTLTLGAVYEVEAIHLAASDFQTTVPGLPGAGAAAIYEMNTSLELVVVPDGGVIGARYCDPAVANSTGDSALLTVGGSALVADDDVTLVASRLPAGQFGMFLVGQTQGFIQNPGGSQGNLCLTGPIGRYSRPGEIRKSDDCGTFSLDIDLIDTPQPTGPVAIQPGETWNFTAWYRDKNPGTTSNFTDAVSVAFQ